MEANQSSWHRAIPFFSERELRCRYSGQLCMDAAFAFRLPLLRLEWGRPLHPTSVCRSVSHNESVGGHPRSLHLVVNPVHPVQGAMAADIWWGDWDDQEQRDFAQLAWKRGWSVGLHPDFCHVDLRRFFLPQGCFTYSAWPEEAWGRELVTAPNVEPY